MTTLQPNPTGILLTISGAAGTGKGTVIHEIMKMSPDFAYSVSATTRAPRPGEIDGVNYHFVSRERFEEMIVGGELIEYTQYCGNYYGTPVSELEKLKKGLNLILEIEVEGASNIKRLYPDSVAVFITAPDFRILRERLVGRGTNTPDDIENRLKRALAEYGFAETFDYAVVNENGCPDAAAEAIINIARSEQHRTKRNLKALDERFPDRIKI